MLSAGRCFLLPREFLVETDSTSMYPLKRSGIRLESLGKHETWIESRIVYFKVISHPYFNTFFCSHFRGYIIMETNSATSVWKSLGNLADDDLTDLYDESCVLSESDGFDMEAAVNQRLDWKPLSGPSPGARVVLDQARRDAWKKAKQ